MSKRIEFEELTIAIGRPSLAFAERLHWVVDAMTSSAISSAAEMPFKVLIVVDGKPNFRVIIDRDGHYIKSLTLLEIKSEIGNHHRELAALGVCDDLQFSFEVSKRLARWHEYHF